VVTFPKTSAFIVTIGDALELASAVMLTLPLPSSWRWRKRLSGSADQNRAANACAIHEGALPVVLPAFCPVS